MNPENVIVSGFAVVVFGAVLIFSGILWGLIQELVQP